MVKISAFAVFAVLAAIVAASPASAQAHHKAAAYRGHTRAAVVDPKGLHAFALFRGDPPGARPDDPALAGGGSAGYNAGLRNNF
jgi:hypothetical protein